MARRGRWPGTWKAVCDSCGFEFPSDELRHRWDGFMVCKDDYETKHPQLDIRIKPERVAPPWTRPAGEPIFIHFCDVISSSCYAGLATADCALADNQQFTYDVLLDMNGNQEVYQS